MRSCLSVFGPKVYQYLAAATATLCILSAEMHFGWSSPSLPLLTKGPYKIIVTGDEASWLAVSILPGTIVGAIIAGKFTERFGRKKVILMTTFPLLIGWIFIAVAEEVALLYAGRFIGGISIGIAFTVVPMYLGEIAEPRIRGMLSSFCPVCLVMGILLINILGIYLPIDSTAMISCIFPLLLFITFIGMPESPTWLFENGRLEEARATLEVLRGKEEADKEMERISQHCVEEPDDRGLFSYFFLDSANRKASLVAYGLRSIQQFCGITAITFFCKTIFEADEAILSANNSTIVYFSLQLSMAFLAIFVVDSFGRKPLLLISIIGCSSTLFLMSIYLYLKEKTDIDHSEFGVTPTLLLFLNVLFLGIGVRNIPFLIMGEIFSPKVKPIASCIGTIYFSFLSIISAKMFFFVNNTVGMYVSFLIFGILSFVSIFFVIFFVPETKGMSLEDIQLKLGKKCRTQDMEP